MIDQMDTKFRVLCVIGAVIVAFCSVMLFINKVSAQEPIEEELAVPFDHTTYTPATFADYKLPQPQWIKDGYEDVDSWWADLQEIKKNVDGLAEAAIGQYGSYLTDNKETELRSLEEIISSSLSVKECKELSQKMENIIDAAKPRPVLNYTVNYSYSGDYTTSDFVWMGVIKENGWKYTWYSQNELPGGGLTIPGRHVGSDNLIHDEDGYIVVAANQKDLTSGDTVETPFGTGKVYDTGCSEGTIDIYTNF